MKITIVQGAFLPVPPRRGGAIEKIWFALGPEFVRRGHEVTHLSRRFDGLPPREVIDGVTHRRVRGSDAPRSLLLLKCLDLLYSMRIVRQLAPADILVTNTFWLPILIRCERLGRLYVHVARYPRGQMRFYRHAARLQTVSRPIMDAIVAEVPDLASRVRTIPNPVVRLPESAPRAAAERAKEILYVGRVHPEKGLRLLIEAFLALPCERSAGWRLVIVGPAAASAGGGGETYQAELQQLAAPLGERIAWIGPVFDAGQLDQFYARASLFVYPSLAERGETFGVAPLEAMSHGCPPLVSDLECFREFLDAGVNGFVFNHRASEPARELTEQIARLLDAPELLSAAGQAGRQKASEFSVERVAGMYLADFQSLVDSRNHSSP